MVRRRGDEKFPRTYVVDSIDGGTLHLRTLRYSLGDLAEEKLELTFLDQDRIELRSGQGARTKIEIYDRVS